MQCTKPLHGYLSRVLNPTGKRSIVFTEQDALTHAPVSLPCGKCLGCRLAYAREWAIRCTHEMKAHDDNCFITLTYDDSEVPHTPSGLMTLNVDDVQRFWKRMRKSGLKVRYFQCGEYGPRTLRPHYHAIVFGWNPADRVHHSDSQSGFGIYTSEFLSRTWGHGFATVQDAVSDVAAYVARYVMKKQVDKVDGSDDRRAEFLSMSKRPGIGNDWATRYAEEWFTHDAVVFNGVECKPPRYYEKFIGNKTRLAEIKAKRVEFASDVEHKRVVGTEVSHDSVNRVREVKVRSLSREGVD